MSPRRAAAVPGGSLLVAACGAFEDRVRNLWVALTKPSPEDETRHDVFDPSGRFLGTVTMPFALRNDPAPIVRGDTLHGVIYDELDVPYLARARIVKP